MAEADEARRARLGPTRNDVLEHLRGATRPLGVQAVAQAVGLHANTARFHLDALVGLGLVDRQPEKRSTPGRPRLVYRAEPAERSPVAVLEGVAGALVQHLERLDGASGVEAEAAGRKWGERLAATYTELAPLERLTACLTELGYLPSLVGDPPEIVVLTPCPLRSLLATDAGSQATRLPSVCRLHLGLMRGLLSDDEELTVDDLEAWATPSSCVARLTPRHASAPGERPELRDDNTLADGRPTLAPFMPPLEPVPGLPAGADA